MKSKDIIAALRCTSTPGGSTGDCEKCPYWKKEQLSGELRERLETDEWTSCDVDKIGMDAADLIECLTAENADLRKELEWKDMVIALAQRKQAEAEAERDALREKLPQWISVEERLPERGTQVLGWYKDNPFSPYRHEIVEWNGGGWIFVYAHRYVTDVTHWMPLPEAPEKGETA